MIKTVGQLIEALQQFPSTTEAIWTGEWEARPDVWMWDDKVYIGGRGDIRDEDNEPTPP